MLLSSSSLISSLFSFCVGFDIFSHLSAVRAVAFGGLPGYEVLVSGGDDMTILVWKMDASVLGYPK